MESAKVIAIVTLTRTGLGDDFDELVEAVQKNETALSHQRGVRVSVGGIDPIQAIRVTMRVLGRVATNLKRSSNGGIGWAFCREHVLQGGALEVS